MDAALVDTMTGDVTYLVYPTTYMYKLKGVPMREAARMAMVLHKALHGGSCRGPGLARCRRLRQRSRARRCFVI